MPTTKVTPEQAAGKGKKDVLPVAARPATGPTRPRKQAPHVTYFYTHFYSNAKSRQVLVGPKKIHDIV